MKIDLETLVRLGWLIVALAVVAPFIMSRVQSGGALLRFLRSKCEPVFPIDHAQLQAGLGMGIRMTLYLVPPVVIYGAYAIGGGNGWWLVILLCGAIVVPAVTIPLSLAHTVLLRCLAFHGPVVSVGLGLVIGSTVGHFVHDAQLGKVFVIYCALYGLIIGLGHTALAAPGIVPQKATDAPQEQPFW